MLIKKIRYHYRKFKRIFWAKRLYVIQWLRNGCSASGAIYFFPEQPHVNSAIYLMYHKLGLRRKKNQSAADLLMYWENDTYSMHQSIGALNGYVTDISKSQVEYVFSKIFGYGSFISKTKKGEIVVQKSEENAFHDGKILDYLPDIDLQGESYCYQRLIFNQPDLSIVEDLRVPVIDGLIPFVYRKIRPVETRFENKNNEVTIHSTKDIFTCREIELIKLFVCEFKLNYGELDVLRDYISGRIYIIDVNKTPWGPPNGLGRTDRKVALNHMSDLFFKRFLKKIHVD